MFSGPEASEVGIEMWIYPHLVYGWILVTQDYQSRGRVDRIIPSALAFCVGRERLSFDFVPSEARIFQMHLRLALLPCYYKIMTMISISRKVMTFKRKKGDHSSRGKYFQ